MKQDSALRLIVVDDSYDDAEEYGRALRALGYAVKSTRVEDAEDLTEAFKAAAHELILCSLDSSEFSLPELKACLDERKQDIPIIALASEATAADIAQIMEQGASDLVRKENQNHLRLVVGRELERTRSKRQIDSLQANYSDSEKRCQTLMESSRDAIAYVHDGMHVYANVAYLEMFGFEAFDEIEGTPLMDMVVADDQSKLKESLRNFARSPEGTNALQTRLKHADETSFSGNMEFSRATIDGEACTQIIIRDRTSNKDLEKQLTLLSQTDQLTGLLNRQHFLVLLEQAVNTAKAGDKEGALLQISLDNFRALKQQAGVLGADQFTADFANLLKELAQPEDHLCRFEGATFLVLTQRSGEEELTSFANSILTAVEHHICEVGDTSLSTTCSIGLAQFDEGTPDTNELTSRVERALSEIREHGGNGLRLYQQKAGERSQKQIDQEWTKRIKKALEKNELNVLYEPIVSLGGDLDERYEVRVRMLDDEGNPIANEEFKPAAERTGLSGEVDRWVIFSTLKKLVVQLKTHENTVFFVRLSSGALDDGELFRWINDRIKGLKLPQGSLVFQFAEGAALARLKQARALTYALHKINCKIAIDRFGTGPNPFQLLKHVPADYLKIDPEFMQNLTSSQENQDAIQSIANKARERNIVTIAPCVEDAGSLSVLWTLGTDLIQGSFLQGPTPNLEYDFSAMMA